MQEIPESVRNLETELSRAFPAAPGPASGTQTPAAEWEELFQGFGVSARDREEVSATSSILNELMRPGMDADRVFELIAQQTAALAAAEGAAIALAEGNRFVCRARTGPMAPGRGAIVEADSGLSGLCLRTRHLLRCDDAEQDPRVDSAIVRQIGVRSISVVPLIKDGKLVGIFEILSSRVHAFQKQDAELLQRMAKLVVLTLSRLRELKDRNKQPKAQVGWWWVGLLTVLAFVAGFLLAQYAGPLLPK